MQVTRRLEFDAGHRIPDHKSQCRHLHGHRYVIEITLSGNIISKPGASENGMVIDFSTIKTLAQTHLIDHWDHAFIVSQSDDVVMNLLSQIKDHKTFVLEAPPTAENLARYAFLTLAPLYRHHYDNQLQLERIRLYETPNCFADFCHHDLSSS